MYKRVTRIRQEKHSAYVGKSVLLDPTRRKLNSAPPEPQTLYIYAATRLFELSCFAAPGHAIACLRILFLRRCFFRDQPLRQTIDTEQDKVSVSQVTKVLCLRIRVVV